MGVAERSWSTEDVDRSRAFSYWIDAVNEAIFELEIESAERDHFHGRLRHEALGPASLSHLRVDQQFVRRTKAAIVRSKRAQYELVYLRSGELSVQQAGKTAKLHRGECILFDSKQPYQFVSLGETASMTVHFPHQWLQCWAPTPEEHIAQPITTATPWGAALLAMLEAVASNGVDDNILPRHVMADQLAGALVLAFGKNATQHTEHSRKLFTRVRQAIQDTAHDVELDASHVARAVGISTRYLHTLCAAAGTTYYTELLDVRLQRAAGVLADSRFRHLSVADVAWRCGFRDPNHFTRRFKQKYALTPGTFRASALSTE